MGATVLACVAVACGGDGGSAEPTPDEYVEQLDAICLDTTATLDALPTPPDEITLVDFASEASSALADEAEQMRQLDPPDELDADHRALIANTDDQSRAWQEMGTVAETDTEALQVASTRIGELTLGRNDLAASLGAQDCVRAAG